MKNPIKVGVIGDFDPAREAHTATVRAIYHAADKLSLKADVIWIPTSSIPSINGLKELQTFDCLWASPGAPYKSMDGAIAGIRIAREKNKPFFGT